MQEYADDLYQNYMSQLHGVLEVLSSGAEEQSRLMGAYNAPWEMWQDGSDFIEAVMSLEKGRLDAATLSRLHELHTALAGLPPEAVNPEGQIMTTAQGCLAALGHPAWSPVRMHAALCLPSIEDPFRHAGDREEHTGGHGRPKDLSSE